MAKLIGIDIGTSGTKALLIDEQGVVLRQASAEYPLSSPQPGWSEQNPWDWRRALHQCLLDLGERNPDAIGLTGQMHGSVFLDAEGEVVRPALLWNDQRTAAECDEIDRVVGVENVRRITCNPPMTGFQLPKVLWLRHHEPEAFARVRKVLLPKDAARFWLSGEMASDVSDASGVGAFDVPGRCWSEDMLAALGLDRSLFPDTAESSHVVAQSQESEALAAGVPIVAGAGDQAAGAVGVGSVERGVVSASLGTSGVIFTALEAPRYDVRRATNTFCHANGAWHAMAVTLACGGSIRWLRDTFGAGRTYDELTAAANLVEPGSMGLTFLPYLSGERCPINDPHARGVFAGLGLGHDADAIARAVFEGVTFSLADAYDALAGLGATAEEIRVTGGGAKSAFWLQMLADVFQARCVTLEADEGPAFGAAILAGVGVGLWPDVVAGSRAVVRRSGSVEPSGVDYRVPRRRYQELYNHLKDWYRE